MNHDDPTDAQIEGLLGTYAEALYQSSIVPDGKEDTPATDGLAVSNTNPKANNMKITDQAALDVDLQPAQDGGSKGRILALVGGVLLVAAVGIGAVSIIGNNDSSELDVAVAEEPTEEEVTEEDSTPTEDASTTQTPVPDDDPAEAADDDYLTITDSAFNPSVGNTTLFIDGEFVSLAYDGERFVVTRGIGDDATSTPAVGLPEGGSAFTNYAVATDSGFVALIEQFPDLPDLPDEALEPSLGGLTPQSTRTLATSPDLINWDTVELPPLAGSERMGDTFVNGLAASGDRIVITGQVNSVENPELVLLEEGLITEEEVFNICSTEFDGSSYSIFTCDFENTQDFEENYEETLLITIDSSDPLFERIEAVATAAQAPETVMLVGPISGPFELIDAPIDGWDVSLAGTPDGFLAVGSGLNNVSQAFSSTDGVTWNQVTPPNDESSLFAFSRLASTENTIVAMTQRSTGLTSFATTDLGQTWTEGSIDTDLPSAFGLAVAGPAGFAFQVQGSNDAYDIEFPEFLEEAITLEKDGYTMTLDFLSGVGTLTGPDGVLIHDNANMIEAEGGIENVVRFEGPGDEDLIWLDPATGEDLITFSEDDLEAAYPELSDDLVAPELDAPEVDASELGSETWFSADGINWTMIDSSGPGANSSVGVAAVGDDEVVTISSTFIEPPSELTNFENPLAPTDEEEAALDAWYAENGDQTTFNVIPVG